jgi:hypothetical protein
VVEQGGVLGLACVFLGRGELALQVGALSAQFSAALLDVADEVLVDVAGKFKVADEVFAGPRP